jgi:1-deoxy-D-xylulose-5-phosphate reductoisomerase
MDCARRGGTAGCVMSAANEEAVHLFLREKIGFNRIYDLAADAVKALAQDTAENLETVLEADAAARRFVHEATGS